MSCDRLPLGWFDLVTDLRLVLMKHFPNIAVTEMTSDRGWLHVRLADGDLDPAERLRLDRLVQGFVTRSLTTCMSCGSNHGRDRGARKEITCDECEMENADAGA
ncbi:hypothetical protein [Agrobacterium sp. LAD9]|uniref:hypothetical protein n=1 Tax=Agrobacterium sp. LAD9 TaxID=2055153 RepID=UPI000D1FB914|nr:hypothetical protein [Agrobacterium sp. LAD9]